MLGDGHSQRQGAAEECDSRRLLPQLPYTASVRTTKMMLSLGQGSLAGRSNVPCHLSEPPSVPFLSTLTAGHTDSALCTSSSIFRIRPLLQVPLFPSLKLIFLGGAAVRGSGRIRDYQWEIAWGGSSSCAGQQPRAAGGAERLTTNRCGHKPFLHLSSPRVFMQAVICISVNRLWW